MLSINFWHTAVTFFPFWLCRDLPLTQNYFQQMKWLWLCISLLSFLSFTSTFTVDSLSIALSLNFFSLNLSGSTHCIGDPRSLRMWLCGFPRAALSGPHRLSPEGGTGLWGRAGSHGSHRGGWGGGISSSPRKHLSVDHHLQSALGSLHVGEFLLQSGCVWIHLMCRFMVL